MMKGVKMVRIFQEMSRYPSHGRAVTTARLKPSPRPLKMIAHTIGRSPAYYHVIASLKIEPFGETPANNAA